MSDITSPAQESHVRLLTQSLLSYLHEGKNRREFEVWYLERYGKPYLWKKGERVVNETIKQENRQQV